MLKSTMYREIKMATPYGEVEIDKEGTVKGLKAEEEKVLGKLPGFEYEENKTAKKEPAKEEKKEEQKQEEKPAPKRTTTRKTTTNSK